MMNSRIYHATNSTPEIDQVLREAHNTLFSDRIAHTPVDYPIKLKISTYKGNTHPRQYLTAFCIAMGQTHFSEEERRRLLSTLSRKFLQISPNLILKAGSPLKL
ncbi:unnamed protein product [Microthlaspi erraticum]|uniref:Uncharacterized protein n=1 Tax=Microthlaspi erraticum TaxID=1685480 RepID=A0A6D2LE71_9BRAS|nr:unnamed protein product [Microthlaspi erraticum]